MLRRLVPPTVAAAMCLSCGGGAIGPSGNLCDTRHEVEVCVDRPEYRSNESIVIATRNLSDRPIFRDACGMSTSRVPDPEDEFTPFYSPQRNCGISVTREMIVERMERLGSGEATRDTLQLGYAPQDFFRAQVWLLTPSGDLAFDTPATSGVFVIFPGANN